MIKCLPNCKIQTPNFWAKLVPLQYQQDIVLCPQTSTRWKKTSEGLERDYEGEFGWADMGAYINKSYYDVFLDSYRSALEARDAPQVITKKIRQISTSI